MARVLKANKLDAAIAALAKAGYRVVGPVRRGELVTYGEVASAAELDLETQITRDSIKRFVLPRSQVLARFGRDRAGKVRVSDADGKPQPTVILGCRPCDAAALPVDDLVFGWDSVDRPWFSRREAVRVVSVACATFDEACFCTSVGGAPDGTDGADVVLVATAGGDFVVRTVSEAGKELAGLLGGEEAGAEPEVRVADVPQRFELSRVRPWLEANFEHPYWRQSAMKCIGCACCTFVCPTCHCFDIVDEGSTYRGERRRNWDACQLKGFTMHASGHNPRPWQEHRYRQRIEHKFAYYPERMGRTLCTGCGRCVRACPVNLSLLEVVMDIAAGKADEAGAKSAAGASKESK